MRISIAVCTYNGAYFLQEQLTSLLNQTYLPDEVIICDDQSTDNTLHILNTFKLKASFPVHIHVNPQRLYSTKNFEKAISLCSGEIIALCDQDDVWLPHKLETALHFFTKSPLTNALFSNGLVVDSNLQSLKYTLWQHVKFTLPEQNMLIDNHSFDVLLKHNVVTGAALIIKASLKSHIFPIPEEWMHDAWIALIAAASNRLAAINEPLFLYRQHEANQIGANPRSWIQLINEALHTEREHYYAKSINEFSIAYNKIKNFHAAIDEPTLTKLAKKLAHLNRRANLPSHRILRIIQILLELSRLGYYRYSANWKVAIKDILLPP